jgi:hypothetical protein
MMKLLTEYENVTQSVLLFLESLLYNAKQLQHARLSWHGNPNSNLESHFNLGYSLCSLIEMIILYRTVRRHIRDDMKEIQM